MTPAEWRLTLSPDSMIAAKELDAALQDAKLLFSHRLHIDGLIGAYEAATRSLAHTAYRFASYGATTQESRDVGATALKLHAAECVQLPLATIDKLFSLD